MASQIPKHPNSNSLVLFTEDHANEGEVVIPESTYRVVGDEVLTETLDPECWAKALAAGGRTKDAALSIYAKLRAEELAEELNWKESKARALEMRKLTAGAPESNYQTRIVWRKRFSLVWDFLFWQVLLSVSGVGLFLVLLSMGPSSRGWPGLLPLVVVSTMLQLLPMLFFGLAKLVVGRVRYTQALGAAAVCLISVSSFIGLQALMDKQMPGWLVTSIEKVVPSPQLPSAPNSSGEEF